MFFLKHGVYTTRKIFDYNFCK